MVSGIVQRGDDLNEKSKSVNKILQQICQSINMGFIPHDNINPARHLNRSNLHLNFNGTGIMSKNFVNVLKS